MKNARPRLDQVQWIDLPSNRDSRGILTSIESGHDTPFQIARIFYMHHVLSGRGGHAHLDTDQVIVAMAGAFEIELRDGVSSARYAMDDPTRGLYVPRMLFIDIHGMTPQTVCLVIASTHYDITRSLRSWDAYLDALSMVDVTVEATIDEGHSAAESEVV